MKLKVVLISVVVATIAFFSGSIFQKETVSVTTDQQVPAQVVAKVSQEEALAKVQGLPEVAEYQRRFAESGVKATIEVEDGEDEWNVHVFEIVKNDDGSSHTATFGWYRVNKQTGTVEKAI